MYKIREAGLEDYTSFSSLHQESREKAVPLLDRKAYQEIIENPLIQLYLVEDNGILQAFTLFYRKNSPCLLQDMEETLFIEQLYVRASEEKKGLKLYLYEKAKRYAERNGIKRIETFLPVAEQEKIDHYEERFKLQAEQVLLAVRL